MALNDRAADHVAKRLAHMFSDAVLKVMRITRRPDAIHTGCEPFLSGLVAQRIFDERLLVGREYVDAVEIEVDVRPFGLTVSERGGGSGHRPLRRCGLRPGQTSSPGHRAQTLLVALLVGSGCRAPVARPQEPGQPARCRCSPGPDPRPGPPRPDPRSDPRKDRGADPGGPRRARLGRL